MSSTPCVLLCLADSVSSLGEAGELCESYPSLFVDAVVPSPLETFNHLLDKLLDQTQMELVLL